MNGSPKWTDKLSAWSTFASAFFALISTGSLIAIALISHNLQKEIKTLTFPSPNPLFSLADKIHVKHSFPQQASINEEITTKLHIAGISDQNIVISSIQVERFALPDPSRFLVALTREGITGITVVWPDNHKIIVEPDKTGKIDTDDNIKLKINLRVENGAPFYDLLPIDIGITIRIEWLELKTHRVHTTKANSYLHIVY